MVVASQKKGDTTMAEKKRAATLIYLDEDVRVRLKHLAADERTSVTELIRLAVDEYVERHHAREKRRKAVKR
jgi:predicted transcriptional regulator